MGDVFLGSSPGGRRVVIKVIRPDFADDPGFRRRFAREVDAARRVGGFHTAQVVDADPAADPPWMVTAYIPGPSLHEAVVNNGPLSAESVRILGAGLVEGLAAIHGCGLVHRDLKPANVIMAEDGPRIIDFGISRAVDATALTTDGAVMGTFAFMSPEQVRGERVGPASDLFSLGSVLAFAATGYSPFHAATIPAIAHRISAGEPDLGQVTDDLRELIQECLAKTPADRRGTAELLTRLTEPDGAQVGDVSPAGVTTPGGVSDETVKAPPPQVAEPVPAGRGIQRRVVLVGGLTAAVSAGAAAAWVSLVPGESEPRARRSAKGTAQPGGGGGDGSLSRIKAAGKIKVGFANQAPYGFRDESGNLTGEAPELARVIFKAMGVDVLEPVPVRSFEDLIPGLLARQFDIIAAGMSITPERCQHIAYSNPDHFSSNAFLVKKGNPAGIKTFAEVNSSGSRLGVLTGASEKEYAEDSGIPGSRIMSFSDLSNAFNGVLTGQVDAFALASVPLRWTLRQDFADRPLEVTEPFAPVVNGKEPANFGAFEFRKEDADLLNAFNAGLAKLQRSNGALPVIQEFGFTRFEVDRAKTRTADQLCAAS